MKNIVEHLVSVIGGETAVRAVNFAATLLIARAYGGSVLGEYAACLAVVTVVVMFSDSGLQTCAITELSDRSGAGNKILGQLYLCKSILIVAAVIFLIGIAFWMRLTSLVWVIGAWVTLRTVLQSYSQLQMAGLKANARANLIGVVQVVHGVFLWIWIWMTFKQGWGIFVLLAGLTVGQLFELTLMILVSRWAGIQPRWPQQIFFLNYMRKSAPFGITYGLANLIIRSDTIVLSALVPLSELGNFSAANAILGMAYVVSWLFGSVVLPEMVGLSASGEKLKSYVKKWVRLIALTMTPCALFAFCFAPKLMIVLYGPAFYRSGALASVMALACPFVFLNSVHTNLAIATNRKEVLMGLFVATAAATVFLDAVLGHLFGPMGVASAIVIREVGMLAGFWIIGSRVPAGVTQLDYHVSS